MIIAGFIVIVAAVILSLSKSGQLKARGGAVVIVGPFPIIFGSDKQSTKLLLALSISLVALLIVLFVLQGFRW